MKYLMIVTILIVSSVTRAEENCETQIVNSVDTREDVNTPTPKELEGAVILVKTKDGKVREMKASEFKVVPRKQQLKVKKQVITQNMTCSPEVVVQKVSVPQKNIISLTVKRSLGDYKIDQYAPGTYHIENRYSPAAGLMYQRNMFKSIYLGVEADTHKAVGGSIGYGF